MTLYINTTVSDEINIALKVDEKNLFTKKIKSPRTQAEKLLPAINNLLVSKKVKLSQLKKIIVANQGGSFTSLRIGVITANALAYALKIPVIAEPKTSKKDKQFANYSLVEPIYDREPNIGISQKPKL
jgi:tRNA threonylcarbamoyl adenosine modification protein YeaZ